MSKIYLPSKGPEGWQSFLAEPEALAHRLFRQDARPLLGIERSKFRRNRVTAETPRRRRAVTRHSRTQSPAARYPHQARVRMMYLRSCA